MPSGLAVKLGCKLSRGRSGSKTRRGRHRITAGQKKRWRPNLALSHHHEGLAKSELNSSRNPNLCLGVSRRAEAWREAQTSRFRCCATEYLGYQKASAPAPVVWIRTSSMNGRPSFRVRNPFWMAGRN